MIKKVPVFSLFMIEVYIYMYVVLFFIMCPYLKNEPKIGQSTTYFSVILHAYHLQFSHKKSC